MTADIERAATFFWTQARLLDRHRFAFLFGAGRREPVLAALGAYANDDGGFGHALECDTRCPASQPVATELALRVLDEIGGEPALAARACDFLRTITTAEGGVPWLLPSARAFPRAPWWQTEDDPPASLNPTAAIAGLLHTAGVRHPWLDRATAYCWAAIDRSPLDEPHELLCTLTFLERVSDRDRAETVFARVGEHLLTSGLVALDPAAPGYVKKPLEWAPTPASLCRRLFDDATIDALAAGQMEDGGWPITWTSPRVGHRSDP